MLQILLLDCSEALQIKLMRQGFHVEAGSVGYSTGLMKLPSQVYEKDIFFYNPAPHPEVGVFARNLIKNLSPEYDLCYLENRIFAGATFVAFLNRLSDTIEAQRSACGWIPFAPGIEFSCDRIVNGNSLEHYPDSEVRYLAPIVTPVKLAVPVLQKLNPPRPQGYPHDVFNLFWNRNGDCLGVQISRGNGAIIFLPTFESNEEVIETFLHRVVPRLYNSTAKTTLAERFTSPAERDARAELEHLQSSEEQLTNLQEEARVRLATASREKSNTIGADATAKQIQIYYDHAKREDEVALYYLYKIVEAIENKFGGEATGIASVGAATEWKAVKRLANESYRDARHAPKPGDVIKKWTDAEIKECFRNVDEVVAAYFATLFPAPPAEAKSGV
jgi:hypothetical protein